MHAMADGGAAKSGAVNLGARLRRARLTLNMTQSDVARGQFSVSYVSAVERGQIQPSLQSLEKLATRLQVPAHHLMRDDNQEVISAPVQRRPVENSVTNQVEEVLQQAQIFLQQGMATEAQETLLRFGKQMPSAVTADDRALWHWHLASTYLKLDRPKEARSELDPAVPLAEQAGDAELRERLRYGQGMVAQSMHQWPLARDLYQECLAAVERGTPLDPAFRLDVLYSLGDICWLMGDYSTATQYLEQAVQLADEYFNAEHLGGIYASTAAAYRGLGDERRARQYSIRSIAAYDEASARRLATRARTRLGHSQMQQSQLNEALSHLQAAHALAEQQDDAGGLAEVQRTLALAYLAEGRLDDATVAVEASLAAVTALNDRGQLVETRLVEARVLEARGDVAGAGEAFESALQLLDEGIKAQYRIKAYEEYSNFLERQGDNTRALDMLKQAWQAGGRS